MIFGVRKLESMGYRAQYLYDPTFSRFDNILVSKHRDFIFGVQVDRS